MLLVPAIIQYLVDAQACTTTDWSSVRSLIYGAAPISDSLLRKAMRALQCDFIQIYGMTEHCGCVALLPPEDHDPERKAELLARWEEHTSELQSLMRITYAVLCLKNKNGSTFNMHTRAT